MADVDVRGPTPSGRARRERGSGGRGPGRRDRMRRRFAWLANPAWARAPLLLRRFPGLLAAVMGAGFILAAVSASSPLFVSSAENQALHESLKGLCPWSGGLAIMAFQPLSGAGVLDEQGRT